MARLRINQGLRLTLDATSTDLQVKSLAGPNNANFLINARNWGIEVRIDEDNTLDNSFRITRGPNGSVELFAITPVGHATVGGFNLRLGTFDQTTRGNSGESRALVKDTGATLVINYAGDFVGGVRVDGPGMQVVGNLSVNGTISGSVSSATVDGVPLTNALSHRSTKILLGNQDWTKLIYGGTNTNNAVYDPTNRGVKFTGEVWAKVRLRVPIHPERLYRVKAKVKKLSGDGGFYIGAISLDGNYNELSTDQATSYNYFGALNVQIPAGQTYYAEGVIGGYNATTENNHKKFDPEAKYFDLIIIANYQTTATPSETVVEWLELEEIYPYESIEQPGLHGLLIGNPADMGSDHFGGLSIAIPSGTGKWPLGIYRAGSRLFTVDVGGNVFTAGNINLLSTNIIKFGNKRLTNVLVDHGSGTETRYYLLGKVPNTNGVLKVSGILAGHTPVNGRGNVDIQIAYRDGFMVDGYVFGTISQADIEVYTPGDNYAYVYLVTKTWAQVNLELSAVGGAEVLYSGQYTTAAPNGSLIFGLSTNLYTVNRFNRPFSAIGVSYVLVSGVTAVNWPAFGAYAFSVGPVGMVVVYPTSYYAGFQGEGIIEFRMSIPDLRTVMNRPAISPFAVFTSVNTTGNSTIYHDNEYAFAGYTYPDSNTLGIRLYRGRFTSADTYNAPNILLLVL